MEKECQDVSTKLTPIMTSLLQNKYSAVKNIEGKTAQSSGSEDSGYGSKSKNSSYETRPTQHSSQIPSDEGICSDERELSARNYVEGKGIQESSFYSISQQLDAG